MRLRALAKALLLSATALPACSGAQKSTEADWSETPEEKPRPVRDAETLGAPTPEPLAASSSGGPRAPLGVRHDLMLAGGPHRARCACLAAEAGAASDPIFFWAGGAPDLGPDALAFALGARGVSCPSGDPDESRRRPSISAVDQENNNVIIEVEDLPEGRPLASGAIIPQPGAGGSIYIRPRTAGQVYARGAPGGRCRVR